MRDIHRIPQLLNRLQELWILVPDLRFGQLIENIVTLQIGIGPGNNCDRVETFLWNTEEDKWEEAIEAFRQHLTHKPQ